MRTDPETMLRDMISREPHSTMKPYGRQLASEPSKHRDEGGLTGRMRTTELEATAL
jgi:hypothetical protein